MRHMLIEIHWSDDDTLEKFDRATVSGRLSVLPQNYDVRHWRILLKKCSRPVLPRDSLELWRQGDSGDDGRSARDAGESFLRILSRRVCAVQSHAARDRSVR